MAFVFRCTTTYFHLLRLACYKNRILNSFYEFTLCKVMIYQSYSGIAKGWYLLLNLLFDFVFVYCNQQSGIAPLHIAVALPDQTGVEITELLLRAGADPNIRDCAFGYEENGRTPAHIACSREDNDQVLHLVTPEIRQALSPYSSSPFFFSLLIHSCHCGVFL